MKQIAYITFYIMLATVPFQIMGQAGIYSESEIEYQNLFIDAKLAGQKGDLDKQVELLKEVIKINRSEHAAYYELALAYKSLENHELAQRNIKKATDLDPGNEWYLRTAAGIAEAARQYGQAISFYKKLIALQPRSREYHLMLAMNQVNNDNWKDAAVALETWQELHGIDEEVSRQLFDIYFGAGKRDKALKVLENLSDQYPDNTRFMNNLAGFLKDMGYEKRAREIYRHVLELDPQNPTASMALVRKETPREEAGDYLQSLMPLMRNPDIPLDNKIMELMPFISRMVAVSPSTDALIHISEILLEQYPDNAKVYAVRGDILFYAGQFEKAEKAYETSVTLDNHQFMLWDQWMLNLWELDNMDKLDRVSYEAIDLFPNQVNAYILRSLALARKGQNDDAREFASEAAIISGGNPYYRDALAVLSAWLSRTEEAPEQLLSIISTVNQPDLSSHLYFELLGDIYLSAGKKDKAAMMWEKAVERGAFPERINKKSGV